MFRTHRRDSCKVDRTGSVGGAAERAAVKRSAYSAQSANLDCHVSQVHRKKLISVDRQLPCTLESNGCTSVQEVSHDENDVGWRVGECGTGELRLSHVLQEEGSAMRNIRCARGACAAIAIRARSEAGQ